MKRILTIAGSAICCVTLATTLSVAGPQKNGGAAKGDAAKGKETFEQCAICHNVDSPEKKMGPSLQGLFKRKTLTNGKPVNDANVLAQINNGGNGMPAYADMLSAEEKANVLAYLHTL
jgi:mono/diheme cytochrome c family protein